MFFETLWISQASGSLIPLYPRKTLCPSLSYKIASQLCSNTLLILYRKRVFFQERSSAGQEGLINLQAPSGLYPFLQGLMRCPAEVSSSKAGKWLWTSWLCFLFPELSICQAPFHHCCNSVFVQTCKCGEGPYLSCFKLLRKRLSMRSYYSEALIMAWHDVVVLALDTSVGVFLKEVAFVAPGWLLSRSSLHQGDIQGWQCDTSLRRWRSAQQVTVIWCRVSPYHHKYPNGILVILQFFL